MSLDEFMKHLDEVEPARIPALLAQLAAAQGALAARLLASGGNVAHSNSGHRGKLLDVSQAAEQLGKTADWLYRNKNKLPFTVRVGRSLRFSEAGLEKWIRSRSGREMDD